MCGDVFDQRRMKRLRAWIVQTRVQCAELVGCMCRANVRKQRPQVVCCAGTALQPGSEQPDSIQHPAEPGAGHITLSGGVSCDVPADRALQPCAVAARIGGLEKLPAAQCYP